MKPRLHYFDMLKGIAIFMVVMGHVLTMCVREIDRAAIFKFIGEVHMPLFFFISGWMAMRLGEGGNVATPSLLPRAKRLLLPMLGASTLWLYYFPLSGLESPLVSTWEGLWSNEWKNGYWFTLVLFEIFAVYAAITPLPQRMGRYRCHSRRMGRAACLPDNNAAYVGRHILPRTCSHFLPYIHGRCFGKKA